jgi:hypothetical protein
MKAFETIKQYISKTILKPFYLSTDASNVVAGAFLYQIEAYERTNEGRNKMLEDLGFEVEGGGGNGICCQGFCQGKIPL